MPVRLAVVLHAHLPWVHHPERPNYLEERWVYEAAADCYLPLLAALRRLVGAGLPIRLTLGLTPPLVEMLATPLLQDRIEGYLAARLDVAQAALADPVAAAGPHQRSGTDIEPALAHYVARCGAMLALYRAIGRDLVGAFGELQDAGALTILTCAATHGYLPLLATDQGRRGQLATARRAYQRHFGRPPRGIWLPECAFLPHLDPLLAEQDLRFFVLETHGVAHASPAPPLGRHAPIRSPHGLVAFPRDPDSGKQVWSGVEGYPGDPVYREFYRDLGWDAPLALVRPLLPDEIRGNTGLKCFSVTGKVDLAEKQPYQPQLAAARARTHAAHFARLMADHHARVAARQPGGPQPPEDALLVAPYDAELFGHWWYEGPVFLEELLRLTAAGEVDGLTLSHLETESARPEWHRATPAFSSWGDQGYFEVWCNERNEWVWPLLHHAERDLIGVVDAHPAPSAAERRLLDQMARELLLAQASDWPFLITQETAGAYPDRRIRTHLARFHALRALLPEADGKDACELLDALAQHDGVFPHIDHRDWASLAPERS